MLSIFPSLLIFGIFAPFILRVVVGAYLLHIGWGHLTTQRETLVEKLYARLGSPTTIFIVFGGLFEVVLGLFLIAGFLTQVMALLGGLYALKLLWFKKEFPVLVPHERIFYILLFAIFLSLLLTGAGAPAVDLPL
ncbi:MAG: DoxX family protein [Candidatus Paceibacterota bacterium]